MKFSLLPQPTGLSKLMQLFFCLFFCLFCICSLHELVDHLLKLSEDTVLLSWPRPCCLWMTVKSWRTSGGLGMSLFLTDIPHQSHRSSFTGQCLICCTIPQAYSEVPLGQPVCFSHFTPLAVASWFSFSASLPPFLLGVPWGYWSTSWVLHMIPIALAKSCFCIGIHARFCVLREITGHLGRSLVPGKGQRAESLKSRCRTWPISASWRQQACHAPYEDKSQQASFQCVIASRLLCV